MGFINTGQFNVRTALGRVSRISLLLPCCNLQPILAPGHKSTRVQCIYFVAAI